MRAPGARAHAPQLTWMENTSKWTRSARRQGQGGGQAESLGAWGVRKGQLVRGPLKLVSEGLLHPWAWTSTFLPVVQALDPTAWNQTLHTGDSPWLGR